MSIMAWSKMKKALFISKICFYTSGQVSSWLIFTYLYIYKLLSRGFDCKDDSWRSVSGKASECTLLLDREVSTWIVKCMFPGSGFLDNVRAKSYRLALEIINARKPLSIGAIFKVLLYQILPSCVGRIYNIILNVYYIKHTVYIYVWFQNNQRQFNTYACIKFCIFNRTDEVTHKL